MDSSRLIQRCKTGDAAVIEELVKTYQSSLFRVALLILEDSAEADEAVQESFISACLSSNNFRGDANLKTWLTAIVVNECRNRLRKRKRQINLQERLLIFRRLLDKTISPERKTILVEKNNTVWKEIESLGEKHRIPIILRYYQDLPITEIAKILEINEGTVHSRLNTARERLRCALSQMEVENDE
jgi:RNA polymerase sigma-70 factor (ECF subfamily)